MTDVVFVWRALKKKQNLNNAGIFTVRPV